jgi:hypothetical protein
MTDVHARILGFWFGLRVGDARPPPNPYPLRSKRRLEWHVGFAAGRNLAKAQLAEAETVAARLALSQRTEEEVS